MLEPRRSGDLLFHTVARVLTYVAFATIGAAAVFIFVMVLEVVLTPTAARTGRPPRASHRRKQTTARRYDSSRAGS